MRDESATSMYVIKVKLTKEAGTCGQTELAGESGPSLASASLADGDTETIQVSAGNPRVEHVTGLVHLYRELGKRGNAGRAKPSLAVSDHLRASLSLHEELR